MFCFSLGLLPRRVIKLSFVLPAAIALLASTARADESKTEVKQDKNHVKVEKKVKRGRTTDKSKLEAKSHRRAGGGTVSKTESTVDHDRPGMSSDSKTTTTETKERDANGNVVRDEKKVDH